MRSDWNFDTVKSISAMGSFRGSAKDLLMPPGMIPEESEESDNDESTIDTGGATKGSGGVLSNYEASHSTVIIKEPLPPPADLDAPLEDDSPSGKSTVPRLSVKAKPFVPNRCTASLQRWVYSEYTQGFICCESIERWSWNYTERS